MDLGMRQACAVVVGAGPGTGLAVARLLAAEGARVSAVARSAENVQRVESHLRHQASEESFGMFAQVDACNLSQMESFVSEVVDRFGAVDVAVCIVGPATVGGGALDVAPDGWELSCSASVAPLVNMCRAIVPMMCRRRTGAIVNVNSVSALQPGTISRPDHGMFKLAALNWVKRLANEVAEHGVRANTVTSGILRPREDDFARAVQQQLGGATVQDTFESYARDCIPLRRCGEPDEVARAVVFLASAAASYITGHNLVVDGGYVKSAVV